MKKLFYIAFALILTSCGGSKEQTGDKAELEKLKTEQEKIGKRIAELEAKLGENKSSEKKESVIVESPQITEFKHYLEIQGRVESDQNVMATTKTPGVINSIKVQRGDVVSQGQILATIDDEVIRNSLKELKTALDLATTVYNKQKSLWDQQIGTEIQYLSAKNQKEGLEDKIATVKSQAAMYYIKSPISGIVDEVYPKVGEMASPGMPVARVVNTAQTKLLADVSESYVGKINAGDEVLVKFPNSEKEEKTSIRVSTKSVNTNNRTFTVEITQPSNAKDILPNMIAKLKINDYTNKEALVVPLNAVQTDDKGTFVFVAEADGKNLIAHKKPVVAGISYGNLWEIKSGLTPEDQIIISGYQNVTEGQMILTTKE